MPGVVEQDWERLMKVVTLELNLACAENKNDFNKQRCLRVYTCLCVCVGGAGACAMRWERMKSVEAAGEKKGRE